MTEPESVTLEFVVRQTERILARLGEIEDQLAALIGITARWEGAVTGLAAEIRGLSQARNGAGRESTP